MASITVYIAGNDTPTNESPSTLGHMWYGLTHNNGITTYYGYHLFGNDGAGAVRVNFDHTYYKSHEYSQKFILNEQQYNDIRNFAEKVDKDKGIYNHSIILPNKNDVTSTVNPNLISNQQGAINNLQQKENQVAAGMVLSGDGVVNPTKIGDLRSALNGRMDETIAQQTELNQERDQVKGDPLTKPQAEKLAASNYLNGADKQLDQQAKELQIKRDKLSQDEKDVIAFGKEHGLDKTMWRKAPEMFKGEGLRYYEFSMATIENNKQVFDRQATEIQTKREQLEVRLQTPEARSEIAKKSEEFLAQDKERLAKLEALDCKLNELKKEKSDIIALKNAIPSSKLENKLNLQGDTQNVQNLLGQTDRIKQQVSGRYATGKGAH